MEERFCSFLEDHTEWGESRFTVVRMENNIILTNNNIKINSVFHIITTISLLLPQPV